MLSLKVVETKTDIILHPPRLSLCLLQPGHACVEGKQTPQLEINFCMNIENKARTFTSLKRGHRPTRYFLITVIVASKELTDHPNYPPLVLEGFPWEAACRLNMGAGLHILQSSDLFVNIHQLGGRQSR